jgi:hypothetical protein
VRKLTKLFALILRTKLRQDYFNRKLINFSFLTDWSLAKLPGVNMAKPHQFVTDASTKKLECFSPASIFSLVQHFRVEHFTIALPTNFSTG